MRINIGIFLCGRRLLAMKRNVWPGFALVHDAGNIWRSAGSGSSRGPCPARSDGIRMQRPATSVTARQLSQRGCLRLLIHLPTRSQRYQRRSKTYARASTGGYRAHSPCSKATEGGRQTCTILRGPHQCDRVSWARMALAWLNSWKVDSIVLRSTARVMKTIRERRSSPGQASRGTGGWNTCCTP